ncbi:MAG: septum formation protein Maf [Nitrospinae bacterium CG11_big_fil_rev_8_21_14_0_20_45_15]|nr:MAG: septum formation protein Maf [Nitrospinae bacterium CG11_big_fil_rev_8_21_14_0_20_45_15]
MSFFEIEIILASKSPRRAEILESMGLKFRVVPSLADEVIRDDLTPAENARVLAEAKALAVSSLHPGSFVLGADTLVVLGDEIIGKPRDKNHAIEILRLLSGKTHNVATGIAVALGDVVVGQTVVSQVTFHSLTDNQIADYVATGEPMDKAGAYAIQGLGKALTAGYEGSWSNIVGLPVEETRHLLNKAMSL